VDNENGIQVHIGIRKRRREGTKHRRGMSHQSHQSCSSQDHIHEGDEVDRVSEEFPEAEEIYDDEGNLLSVGELVFVPGKEPLGVGSYATVRLAYWKRSATVRRNFHLNTEDFSHLMRAKSTEKLQQNGGVLSKTSHTPIVSFGEYSTSAESSKPHGDDSMSICSDHASETNLNEPKTKSRLVPSLVGHFGHILVRVISTLGSSLLGDPMSTDVTDDEVDKNHNHSHVTIEPDSSSSVAPNSRGRLETVEDERGKLVAVKILSKSLLKRMRTLHRTPSSSRAPSASPSFERLSSSSASSNSLQLSPRSYNVHIHTALQRVEQEIALMKLIRHPNIIALQHVIDSPESDALYMVLDFAPLGEIMTFDPSTTRFHRRSPDSYSSQDDRTAADAIEQGLVLPGRYFNEHQAALYFVDVMHGLAYLHQHHICHRDLKPENIMLEYNKLVGGGVAKIADFGVSHFFEEETGIGARRISWRTPSSNTRDHDPMKSSTCMSRSRSRDAFSDVEDSKPLSDGNPNHRHHPKVLTRYDTDSALKMVGMSKIGRLRQTEGTWCFWSPEMCSMQGMSSNPLLEVPCDTDGIGDAKPSFQLRKQKLRRQNTSFSGYASDIWAAGICLYIFSSGRTPFYSEYPDQLFAAIADGKVPYDGLGFSPQLIDLLEHVLDKDPDMRFGIGECLKHHFCHKARKERIHNLGEELRRVSEMELIVKAEDILNAFSIAKLADGAAKIIKEKHRIIQNKVSSDFLGFKKRIDSASTSFNDDAIKRELGETSVRMDQMSSSTVEPPTCATKLVMELGTFSNHQTDTTGSGEIGNTSCSIQ
jgi:serine/threonine protein kinase